jgi:hypothetical protein
MKKSDFFETTSNVFGFFVGLLTFTSAVIPIFSTAYIEYFFIDINAIQFTTVMGLVLLVLTSWFCASLDFFIVMKQKLENIFNARFYSIPVFMFSIVSLYLLKVLFTANQISFSIASIFQIISYLLIFVSAGIIFGVTIQSTINNSKYQRKQEEYKERIFNTLTRNGYLQFDYKIKALVPLQAPYIGYIVKVELKGVEYLFKMDTELNSIIEELPIENAEQELKKEDNVNFS